jgi:hypothetical protein
MWHHINDVEHNYCWGVEVLNDVQRNFVIEDNVRSIKKTIISLLMIIIILSNKKIKCVNCGRLHKYLVSLEKHMISYQNRKNITC